jgi:hypothetical protein
MNVAVSTIIEQAIEFERGLAELYLAFHHLHPQDSDFWWELSLAELSHASLLESGRQLFDSDLEEETIRTDFELLVRTNKELESLLDSIGTEPPSREKAHRIALELEASENEKTLCRIFQLDGEEPAGQMMNQLLDEDRQHSVLIRNHAKKLGLDLDQAP